MNKLIGLGRAVGCAMAVCGFAANGSAADWTYDSSAKTITDGTSVLKVTVANTTNLTISTGHTAVGSELDFSGSVTDAGGTAYRIVAIGDKAFNGCTTVTRVWFPETLISIGGTAFYGASALTEIHLPSGIQSIGSETFRKCSSLTTVEPFLPTSLKTLTQYAFAECPLLSGDLALGNSDPDAAALSVANNVFMSDAEILSVTIGDNVTAIGNSAFSGCSGLEEVTLPQTLTSIGNSAFVSCARLKKVTPFLPPNLTTIGSQAFDACKRLSAAELLIGIGYTTDAPPALQIGTYAFRNCSLIESVRMGPGVTKVSDNAFQNCTALRHVEWTDSITSIGGGAFNGCSVLESVTPFVVPPYVTSIGGQAFYTCPLLSGEIEVGLNNAVSFSGQHQFAKTAITKITLGDGVTSVPANMCLSCTSLRSLTLGANITTLGNDAFNGCTALSGVVRLPEVLTTIGSGVFSGCGRLEGVDPFVPASVTSIGGGAFFNCTSLAGELYFATNNATASFGGQYAFEATKITKVVLGDGITSIPNRYFCKCGELTYAKLPANLLTLGECFQSCPKLKKVEPFLPKTLTSLAGTFMYGSVLEGSPWLGSEDPNATELKLTGYGFYQDYAIGPDVYIGANVKKVAGDHFRYNTGIKSVYFLGDTTWDSNAFNNWANYQARFVVSKDSATWDAFVANSCTVPTVDELATYRATWPGEPDPRGVTKANPAKVFVVSYGMVKPGEKNVTVSGLPNLFAPESEDLDPKYGLYENCGAALPMTLTAPRYAAGGTVLYESRGTVVETPTVIGWGNGVTNALSGDGVRFVEFNPQEDGSYRLSWLWEPAGYQAAFTLPDRTGIGSVTCSEPDLQGFYSVGSTATFTAVPEAGVQFVKWIGDVPAGQETSPTITVTMNGPKALTPEFASPWIYDAQAKTVTDGFWTLAASGSLDAITIGKPSTAYALGVLDLTKPVKDADGNPGAIVAIGTDSFNASSVIREVRIGSTLTTIGQRAFYLCTSITNVTPFLPPTVTTVMPHAFSGATNLKGELEIGFGSEPGAVSVQNNAFESTAISNIRIGSAVTTVSGNFANKCGSLTNVTAHEAIGIVGANAFSNCGKLKTFSPLFPAATTNIGSQVFFQSSALASDAAIGTNGFPVSFGGGHIFAGTSVPNILLGEGVSDIPFNFASSDSKLETVTMADTVKKIGSSAFNGSGVKKIVLSSKLEVIEADAIRACASLVSLEPSLPNTVTNIGNYAFYTTSAFAGGLTLDPKKRQTLTLGSNPPFQGMSGLTEIVLGTGVQSLPNNCFDNCKAVRKLYLKGNPAFGTTPFKSWTAQQAIVYFPRSEATWMTWLEDSANCTPWDALDRETQDQFFDRYPTEKAPFGKLTATTIFGAQWVEKWNPNATGMMLIFR